MQKPGGLGPRTTAVVGCLVVGAALISIAPRAAGAIPGFHTYPAGLNLHAVPGGGEELAQGAPLAPTGSYDPDRVADKYAQFEQAKALPLANSTRWKDVGPLGVDEPPQNSANDEQFLRVAGMGSALAADTNDPSGNTVYMGDMGGLWKSTDGGDHWHNLSDGTITSAGVGAIALDPSRPNDIYVGTGIAYLTLSGDTYGTGLYVSHDGGHTFNRPNPNVAGWAVTVIRVTPTAVFVGTNHGLYRSTDHGDSLVPVPLPDDDGHTGPATGPYANWISDVAVRPGHPDEVTAAVGFADGRIALADGSVASPGNGLYRSMSGGTPGSFTAMDVSGLTTPQSSVDPIGRISLAYGQTASDDGVLWAFVSDAGLAAGQGMGGQLPDQVPNKTNTVLNGLFRSPDDGASWTAKATPTTLLAAPNSTLTPEAPLGYSPGVQAYYEDVLVTDPVTPDQVYFGLEEAYENVANTASTPGPGGAVVIERYADVCGFFLYTPNVTNGAACPSQAPLYGGYTTHPDQHAMVAVKAGSGVRLYSVNDGGTFRQDAHDISGTGTGVVTGFDNNSWTPLNTMDTIEPWHVVMLPDGEILAGLQDNGVSLNGADRQGAQVGLGDGVFVFPTADPNIFYISVDGGGFFVTHDHGQNLTEIQPSLTNPTFLSPFAVDPTDPNHIVSAAENVEETLKGPNTTVTSDTAATGTVVSSDWSQSFDAGSSGVTNPFTHAVVTWNATALDVRGAVVYGALCAVCSAYRENFATVSPTIETNVQPGCTPNKGASDCWHVVSSKGLSPGYIGSLVIDPADTNTVYASVIERQFVGYPSSRVPGRVFVSHDGGQNFTDITGNLPRGSAWRLVIRGGQLIAATDVGVFTAPMTGQSWSRLGTGLPATAVRDAWIDPTGRYLLVSAYGRGVQMLDFGSTAQNSNGPSSGQVQQLTQQPPGIAPAVTRATPPALPNTSRVGVVTAPAGVALIGLGLLLAMRRRRARR